MATIKVFDVNGVKILNCFDTLEEVPYEEEDFVVDEDVEDDTIGF